MAKNGIDITIMYNGGYFMVLINQLPYLSGPIVWGYPHDYGNIRFLGATIDLRSSIGERASWALGALGASTGRGPRPRPGGLQR